MCWLSMTSHRKSEHRRYWASITLLAVLIVLPTLYPPCCCFHFFFFIFFYKLISAIASWRHWWGVHILLATTWNDRDNWINRKESERGRWFRNNQSERTLTCVIFWHLTRLRSRATAESISTHIDIDSRANTIWRPGFYDIQPWQLTAQLWPLFFPPLFFVLSLILTNSS